MGSDRGGARATLVLTCRDAFDRWERFTSSRAGIGLMFAWAVGEATVWPIIPDFLLIPMAAGSRRRFGASWAAAVAGMAMGGTATFLFGRWWPERAARVVSRLPMVGEREIVAAKRYLTRYGIRAYLFQPWSGIPYKAWGVVGGGMRLNPLAAIPTFVAARALRMGIFAAGAALVTRRFAGFVRDHSLVLLMVYLTLFIKGLRRLAKRG